MRLCQHALGNSQVKVLISVGISRAECTVDENMKKFSVSCSGKYMDSSCLRESSEIGVFRSMSTLFFFRIA